MICNKISRDNDEELICKMTKLPTELILKIYSYTTIPSGDNDKKNDFLQKMKPCIGFTLCLSTSYSIGLGFTKIPYGMNGEFIVINTVAGLFTEAIGSVIIYNCWCKDY